jgi:hypothetical protein
VVFKVVEPLGLTAPTTARNHTGETVTQQLTGTGGVSPYKYSANSLPTGLAVNATTGAITGTVTAVGTFPVEVTVTDNDGGTVTKAYTHHVYAPVTLGAIAAQSVTMGSTFTTTAVGSGGNASYTYSAIGLPVGMSVNATTGVISGLATIPGRYLPVVTVSDGVGGAGGTATRTFELIVTTPSSLIFTSPAFAVADRTSPAGVPTSMTVGTNGGLLGLSPALVAAGLPPGMTFNPLTATISGTPTTPGVYRVTMVATNLLPPQTSNLTFLWTVT